MSRNINIAMVQMHSCIGQIEKNVDNAIKSIKQSAEKGADIVCFPELFATGYNMDFEQEYTVDKSIENYNYITSKLSEVALNEKIHIIAPIAIVKKSKVYNSALFIDDHGKIIGDYGKTHLYSKEANLFNEGEEIKIFDTKLAKIGIMICYDAGFPEVCRTLALKGAEIVFCPSAWKIQDKSVWDLNLSQRALENTLFVVGVNSVGTDNNLHLFGNSKILNPRGEIVVEIDENIEEVLVTTVDVDSIQTYRNYFPYLRDRKPNLYGAIVDN